MSKVRRKKKIIRNDDVSYDTDLEELKKFCKICDKYGFKILHAVTPMGITHNIDVKMDNPEIIGLSSENIFNNKPLVRFLQKRNDLIGVHGLWHIHQPSKEHIREAKRMLKAGGLKATYFVPPFNEGDYGDRVLSLNVSKLAIDKGERLEDYLKGGTPTADIVYLHSWRFDDNWYTFKELDSCLRRLAT